MTNQNELRWYRGEDIIREYGIEGFELLDAIKAGKLTPYDPDTGKKVIDLITLKRLKTPEEIKSEVTTERIFHNNDDINEPPDVEIIMSHPDFDIAPNGFCSSNVGWFIYKADEVGVLLGELIPEYEQRRDKPCIDVALTQSRRNLPDKMQEGRSEGDNSPKVTHYIIRRRKEGVEEGVIAVELNDKSGPFKLSYAILASELGLNENLNPTQHGTLKQRGKRLCEKGKKLLQKK